MRTPRHLVAAVLVAALPLVPIAAQGQQAGSVGLGLSAGANLPTGGRFGDNTSTGLVLTGIVSLRVTPGAAIRGELFYSRSDIDNPLIRRAGNAVLPETGVSGTSGNVDLIAGTVNVELPLTSASLVQPYLIGGAGLYHRRVKQDVVGSVQEFRSLRDNESRLGVNGGLGLRLALGGLAAFAEARYHYVATSFDRTRFIPITVGIIF